MTTTSPARADDYCDAGSSYCDYGGGGMDCSGGSCDAGSYGGGSYGGGSYGGGGMDCSGGSCLSGGGMNCSGGSCLSGGSYGGGGMNCSGGSCLSGGGSSAGGILSAIFNGIFGTGGSVSGSSVTGSSHTGSVAISGGFNIGQSSIRGGVISGVLANGSVINQTATGLIPVMSGGSLIGHSYCIDAATRLSSSYGYQSTAWSSSNVQNMGQVQWIMGHSFPTIDVQALATASGVIGLTQAQAIAATQAAVWHFTNGFQLHQPGNNVFSWSGTYSTSDQIYKLYQYLISQNAGGSEPKVQIITVPGTAVGGTRVGPIHVVSPSGGTVSLQVTGAAVSFFYADGTAVDITKVKSGSDIYFQAPAGSGSITITASAQGGASTGQVLTYPGSQPLVVATQTSSAMVRLTVQVSWTASNTNVTPPPFIYPTADLGTTTGSVTGTTTGSTTGSTTPPPTADPVKGNTAGETMPAPSVTISQSVPATTTTTTTGGSGTLPNTGGPSGAILAMALTAMGAGALVLRRRKR